MIHEMVGYDPSYPPQTAAHIAGQHNPPTLSQRLEREEEFLEQRLANVRRARELVEANPDLAELQTLLQTIG